MFTIRPNSKTKLCAASKLLLSIGSLLVAALLIGATILGHFEAAAVPHS